jgi:hypothetical protein
MMLPGGSGLLGTPPTGKTRAEAHGTSAWAAVPRPRAVSPPSEAGANKVSPLPRVIPALAPSARGNGQLAAEAQEDAGSPAGQRVNEVILDRGDRELEVVNRGGVDPRCPVEDLWSDSNWRCRNVVDVTEQLIHVHVLGSESRAQDIVRARHDLNRHALQVGMDSAGRDEHRLAGLQCDRGQQQRRHHPGITRISLG